MKKDKAPDPICKHKKHQIAEREFYNNQKNKFSGTRIICKKCGANKFYKDIADPHPSLRH